MSYVEQLERETERTRSQLAGALDELRSAMTPGQIVDQITDRLGLGDGDATRLFGNFKRQAVENPLPLALVGAGLAWLAFARRNGGVYAGSDEPAERVGPSATQDAAAGARSLGAAAREAREQAGESIDNARRFAADAAETMKAKAGSAMDSVRDSASGGYDALSRGAQSTARGVAESARAARRQTMRTGARMADFLREQPLALAGLGLAIGAALGALAPQSETEERMLADAGADLGDTLKEKAEAVRDTARRAAENAMDAAANTAFEGRSQPSGETRGGGTRANETTAGATGELAPDAARQTARGE